MQSLSVLCLWNHLRIQALEKSEGNCGLRLLKLPKDHLAACALNKFQMFKMITYEPNKWYLDAVMVYPLILWVASENDNPTNIIVFLVKIAIMIKLHFALNWSACDMVELLKNRGLWSCGLFFVLFWGLALFFLCRLRWRGRISLFELFGFSAWWFRVICGNQVRCKLALNISPSS